MRKLTLETLAKISRVDEEYITWMEEYGYIPKYKVMSRVAEALDKRVIEIWPDLPYIYNADVRWLKYLV